MYRLFAILVCVPNWKYIKDKTTDIVSTEMTWPLLENEKIEEVLIFWDNSGPNHCFYEPS